MSVLSLEQAEVGTDIAVREGRLLLGWRRLGFVDRFALVLLAAVSVLAIIGPWLAPHDPIERVGDSFLPPGGGGFLLGTDESGRDVWSRTLVGLQSTWLSAIAVIVVTAVVGAAVGTYAGASGGWVDSILMRITDFFLALPGPLVAIAAVAAFGTGLRNTLIALAIVWWPWYARIVRNEIRALTARPHVEAARLAGARPSRVRRRHLLPGAVPPLLVAATLDVGTLIISLTALSFLGLGAPPPAAELGAMVNAGSSYVLEYWWLPVVPSVAIMIMALAANLAGDAARTLVGIDR